MVRPARSSRRRRALSPAPPPSTSSTAGPRADARPRRPPRHRVRQFAVEQFEQDDRVPTPLGRPAAKCELLECGWAPFTPERPPPAGSLTERDRSQLVARAFRSWTSFERCASNCRGSRSAAAGTSIRVNRSSPSNWRICRGFGRSSFCLRTTPAWIRAGSPIHSSRPNSSSKRSNQLTGRSLPSRPARAAPKRHRTRGPGLTSRPVVVRQVPLSRRSQPIPAGTVNANHNLEPTWSGSFPPSPGR